MKDIAKGHAKSFTLSMQFTLCRCMFPLSPSRGQISRTMKAAFCLPLPSAITTLFSLFPSSETRLTRREKFATSTCLMLQIKLPHSSISSYQKLDQQRKCNQKIAAGNKECMWVTKESYPAYNYQNQPEMKQLQESKVFAKLPGVS